MLIRVHKDAVSRIEGAAHIVVSLRSDGSVVLSSEFDGRWDSMYAPLTDAQLLGRAMPELVREENAALRRILQGHG